MKKHILFCCTLEFMCVCSIVVFSLIIPYCKEHWENVRIAIEFDSEHLSYYRHKAIIGTILAVFCGISMLLSFSLFLYMNPRLFRRSTYANIAENATAGWEQNKAERAAARSAKAETDKQKRIEELQKELDELQDGTNSNP